MHMIHQVSVSVDQGNCLAGRADYPAVEFVCAGKTFHLFVEDEYHDYQIGNSLLDFCLVLRELENYLEASDYLEWCQFQGLEVSSIQIREFYLGLDKTCHIIKELLGEIDSKINPMDFELNAGSAQYLRNQKI